ncbi:hypothetical protein TraAM80_09304 [Trypanosoma rangeli]|uniref:PrimPol-like protein 2 n=1 Tax=Trypanosoma rangeli TaxID=5698 RepID=A0A3R7N6P4_TRYRA|nr:uncharacterized protein TraAM80_09304 [Trypanosoma rangeli]RNE97452.1 hypothetical protein TraAM80_09304 [Trypanosoma rangeli]|eukprot:RNE97452.1 hypothetical protein TraAM80_09304 [Trypanosoma rangeli]
MEPRTKAPRHETKGTSVNAIFALTGPSAGVLHIRSDSPLPQAGTLDDAVMSVLNSCFGAVAVLADQYWRAASQHHTLFQTPDSREQAAVHPAVPSTSLLLATGTVKRPDPNSIPRSFYHTRLDAISNRRYVVDHGALVIAADNRSGSGGKMFNTLPRQELASFVDAIPMCHQRNLYVLVDENAAVDPFFDIDCPIPFPWLKEKKGEETEFDAGERHGPSPLPVSEATTASVEDCLGQILRFLRDKVEAETGSKLRECVVLTSSVIVQNDMNTSRRAGSEGMAEVGQEEEETSPLISSRESKLSFHVHFRLDSNTAFANVRELHKFMLRVREELDVALSSTENSNSVCRYRMLRQCIDFGVYTRWRAFRLPYNVKALSSTGLCPVDAAGLDLMRLAVSQFSQSIFVPEVDVGAVAPLVVQHIDLSFLHQVASSAHRQHQHRMITKLFFLFRFLLPVIPGKTAIGNKDLFDFLSKYVPCLPIASEIDERYRQNFVSAVFDLAAIQRDKAPIGMDAESDAGSLRLIAFEQNTGEERSVEKCCDPFAVPRPPHRDGVRIPVHDKHVKELVAEVFRCLCAAYNGCGGGGIMVKDNHEARSNRCGVTPPIMGDRVSVQYQDGIRAYYVQQKVSRYCLNQGRAHRGTYPQLYLTYASIKLRCYSNDCHHRCLAVRWSTGKEEQVMGVKAVVLPVNECGYPKYERLTQIRHLLFPPLPPEELLRRYGSVVLGGVQPQEYEEEMEEQV